MAEIDQGILQQMIGMPSPARAEAKPATTVQIPEAPDDVFLQKQAVAPASDLEPVAKPSEVLNLTDTQQAILATAHQDTGMSADDRAFWDRQSGKTQAEEAQAPQAASTTSSPSDQRHSLREALGIAREHGHDIKGEGSVFDRLIRAKDKAKQAFSKVTDVLVKKGHVITGKVDAAHDLYVGLKDDPEIRKEVAQIAVDASREVIEVPFVIAGEKLEEILTSKINIGGKEYVPIDEMIRTAEAVESGIKNTADNAVELARMTARSIKNRIQDSLDVARIAHNLTLAKLAEGRKRDRETMQMYIEGAEKSVRLAQDILRRIERGIDRVRTKGDTPEHLQNVATAKRQEAFGILGTFIARKDAIFGIRKLAETPQAEPIAPQAETVRTPKGPVTSSSDPRFSSLSDFEQDVIRDREQKETPTQPTPLSTDRHPLNNTIL